METDHGGGLGLFVCLSVGVDTGSFVVQTSRKRPVRPRVALNSQSFCLCQDYRLCAALPGRSQDSREGDPVPGVVEGEL